MFDLGWVEILFALAIALVIVGPKDLPNFIRSVASSVRHVRNLYRNIVGNLSKLEKEADGMHRPRHAVDYRNFLPESIRRLPDDFVPGSMSAEQHQQRRAAFEQAREQSQRTTTDEASSESASPDERTNQQ